jgi:hypothetical protein
MTEKRTRIRMKSTDPDSAYIYLPGNPDPPQYGIVAKTLSLDDLIVDFKGPRIHLDFNKEGVLIGIEILILPSRAEG